MIADALSFMGAEISYYSRSRKPEAEQAGMTYKPLDRLLSESEVVFTCLNKNVLLLGAHEFEQLGAGKALFNTSIGPGFDSKALENWLNLPNTHFFCDTYAAAAPWPRASSPARTCAAPALRPDAPSRRSCC